VASTELTVASDTVVLVPSSAGLDALADVPGVHALRYDVRQPADDEQRRARVLVPRGGDIATIAEYCATLPDLRLVQLLSAGYDHWDGRLQPTVELSNCRGALGPACAEWVLAVLLSHVRELPAFASAQLNRRWEQRRSSTQREASRSGRHR
jgi:phosphoglycerate dehydrogenase-like enzyme